MRYPRHAKIFRGQLDPAPFAAVLLLLVVFLLLASLVYTPGVLIDLDNAGAIHSLVKTITVSGKGEILFRGKTFQANELEQLRVSIKSSGSEPLSIRADAGAPKELVARIRELVRVDPPKITGFTGTDGPTLVLAVNLRGQLFWENHVVSETELRTALQKKLAERPNETKDVTLVLLADKMVENEMLVRLSSLARECGLHKVLLATRPSVFSGANNSAN